MPTVELRCLQLLPVGTTITHILNADDLVLKHPNKLKEILLFFFQLRGLVAVGSHY